MMHGFLSLFPRRRPLDDPRRDADAFVALNFLAIVASQRAEPSGLGLQLFDEARVDVAAARMAVLAGAILLDGVQRGGRIVAADRRREAADALEFELRRLDQRRGVDFAARLRPRRRGYRQFLFRQTLLGFGLLALQLLDLGQRVALRLVLGVPARLLLGRRILERFGFLGLELVQRRFLGREFWANFSRSATAF